MDSSVQGWRGVSDGRVGREGQPHHCDSCQQQQNDRDTQSGAFWQGLPQADAEQDDEQSIEEECGSHCVAVLPECEAAGPIGVAEAKWLPSEAAHKLVLEQRIRCTARATSLNDSHAFSV